MSALSAGLPGALPILKITDLIHGPDLLSGRIQRRFQAI